MEKTIFALRNSRKLDFKEAGENPGSLGKNKFVKICLFQEHSPAQWVYMEAYIGDFWVKFLKVLFRWHSTQDELLSIQR